MCVTKKENIPEPFFQLASCCLAALHREDLLNVVAGLKLCVWSSSDYVVRTLLLLFRGWFKWTPILQFPNPSFVPFMVGKDSSLTYIQFRTTTSGQNSFTPSLFMCVYV